MKFILSFVIALSFLTACNSKKSDPNPTPSIVGTWKETRIISITYTNNIATKADTLPVSNTVSNSEFYSTFNADGTYQDYLLSAGVKSSPGSGTYKVTNSGTTFTQSPNNVAANPQASTPDTPSTQRGNYIYSDNSYTITFQDANHVTLTYTASNNPADPGIGMVNTTTYSVTRMLTRVN